MQTCLFRGEITTFCCVMRLKSRDFSLIWALLHDFSPFSLQICVFVREKSCSPINFSRFARLLPLKVVISSSFWPAITTPRLCLHYLTIGMKKGKNVSTFFPFFSVYFRATAACGMRAVGLRVCHILCDTSRVCLKCTQARTDGSRGGCADHASGGVQPPLRGRLSCSS